MVSLLEATLFTALSLYDQSTGGQFVYSTESTVSLLEATLFTALSLYGQSAGGHVVYMQSP